MNIDWDRVAGDAEETPRALLAEILAEADDIETLVVIVSKPDADDPVTKHILWETRGDGVSALGLVQYALVGIRRHVVGNASD